MSQWKNNYKRLLASAPHECEVYASSGESFEVGLLAGEIETYEVSGSFGISLRVKDARTGYAFTQNAAMPADTLYAQALANAACVESADEAPLIGTESISIDAMDEALQHETSEYKIALAQDLNRLALARSGIERLKSCCIITSWSETDILNTLGLNAHKRSGYAIAYADAVATKDGQTKNGSAFDIAKTCAGLNLARVADEAAEEALTQLGASSLPAGKYDVLLRYDAAVSFIKAFFSFFSGEAAMKGLSLFADKVGAEVASPCVSIVDAPKHPLSVATCEFDAEGTVCREKYVVQGGVLKTLLHNAKTAKKYGVASTGNAGKGSQSSQIDIRPNIFYIQPGKTDWAGMKAALGKGLIVTHFSGLHSGVNAVSGDFSLQCRGFFLENGRTRPIEQITLAGNFAKALPGVELCGSDLKFSLPGSGCCGSPSLLLRDMSVSGK